MDVLSLRNVSVKRKRSEILSLDNISFDIESGSFHTFIGENGAGKSTTMKCIVGQICNFDGNIYINNKDTKTDSSSRLGICYIPDKAIFPNNISAFDYLYNAAKLIRDDKIQLKNEIEQLLNDFDLKEIGKRNLNHLSSGQKKKIYLIKCIVEKSQIVILDEPVVNLDPTTRQVFLTKLKELTNYGVTIFISTHILEEIKNYATHATFIKKGKIIWSGNVEDNSIIEKYNDIYVKGDL